MRSNVRQSDSYNKRYGEVQRVMAKRRKDQDEESVIIYNSYARIMQREQRESGAVACVFIAREKNFCM